MRAVNVNIYPGSEEGQEVVVGSHTWALSPTLIDPLFDNKFWNVWVHPTSCHAILERSISVPTISHIPNLIEEVEEYALENGAKLDIRTKEHKTKLLKLHSFGHK